MKARPRRLAAALRSWKFYRVIPEIDIWRAATLMLKRYGEKALEESDSGADELASAGDDNGVAVWRRISDGEERGQGAFPEKGLRVFLMTAGLGLRACGSAHGFPSPCRN